MESRDPHAIAIIAVAGRFPGARDVDAFWTNLVEGTEAIRTYADAELRARGVPDDLRAHPKFVPAGALVEGIDEFDAALFAFTRREAELLDPQHRVFFECVWEALERAGYAPGQVREPVGLFAGTSLSTYLLNNLIPEREAVHAAGIYQAYITNDKDSLTTHVAYKLNLRGPSVTVQTACSTSLVAVQLACQSLTAYQCDMALAGGVSLQVPHQPGYVFQDGAIASPDGHCRAFDATAAGTVPGNGAGVVVLKRLADAVDAGDQVLAVIRGAAVNNDGSAKVGYTAPGADGQAEVIALAQALADVSPDSIGYVEGHGTGTPLGDPIEIGALTRVFRAGTERKRFCALGSVKTNIGHLDAAAGVAGLIKATLAVQHGIIPPSLHFTQPNPKSELANGPFFVPTTAMPWPLAGPRRAGVSSFGIGGTNAHVILEEAPAPPPASPSSAFHVLSLSARSTDGLDRLMRAVAARLASPDAPPLADAAYTLHVGRRHWPHRAALVCETAADAAAALAAGSARIVRGVVASGAAPVTVGHASTPPVDESTASAVARAWVDGAEINWQTYYAGQSRRRVLMPVTPFERQRYWIDPPGAADRTAAPSSTSSDHGPWLYTPAWSVADAPAAPADAGHVLIVGGHGTTAEQLAGAVRAGGRLATTVAADQPAIVAAITRQQGPLTICYLGTLANRRDAHDASRTRHDAFDIPIMLAQAVAAAPRSDAVSLVFVVNRLEDFAPDRALLGGPALVIPQEYRNIRCRVVDVDAENPSDEAAWVAQLAGEIAHPSTDALARYRDGVRSVRVFPPFADNRPTRARLKPGGVYWITGASGAIGRAIATYLARTYKATLLLTSRTLLPADLVRGLEAEGSTVQALAADVADPTAMRAARDAAVARFGRLDGIIHTAGVPGGGLIALRIPDAPAAALEPKVAGTRVIAALARETPVDFLALCSSLAAIHGGLGQVDYVAANAFLDAFAGWHTRESGVFTVSIGWDAWHEAGMAVNVARSLGRHAPTSGLSAAQGVVLLDRILSGEQTHVLVSATPLGERTVAPHRAEGAPTKAPRRDAGVSIDARVAGLWQRMLGTGTPGHGESFFDSGGDSLTAVQLVALVNEEFGTDLSVAAFFGAPTISGVAALVHGLEQPAPPGTDPELDPSRERGRRRSERRRGSVPA